ncbi:MAG: putative rane protein [Thermoleophilaceae bacterium]|nr:putative rane protein [Thermoleophilaceae bacterium]
MTLSLDPAVIVGLGTLLVLYARAVRVLASRGWGVPRLQQASWYTGVGLMAIALVSPLDPLGDDLLSAHMAQHLLMADLSAPLLLIGVRTPVLVFLLPRPALVSLARRHWLRSAFRTLRRPLVAVPLWVVTLYGWHMVPMFQGALGSPFVHALQHESFIAASLLVWWSVIEPQKSHTRAELWKAGHVIGARVAGMFLGMAFAVMLRTAIYPAYGDRAAAYGLTPLADQQIAGGMMIFTDLLIMLVTLGFFFWAAEREVPRQSPRVPVRASAGASAQRRS